MTPVMSVVSTPKSIQSHPNPSSYLSYTKKNKAFHCHSNMATWHPHPILPSSHPMDPMDPMAEVERGHAEQAVGIHDRIRAVNGASGTPEERVLWRVVWGMKWALWVALGWVYPEKMGCNTVIHRNIGRSSGHDGLLRLLKPDMGRKMWGYHEGNDVKLWCWVMKYEESIIIYWINWGSCHQTCGDIIWGVLGHES